MAQGSIALPRATVNLIDRAIMLADFNKRREAKVSQDKVLQTFPIEWSENQKKAALATTIALYGEDVAIVS